MASLLCQIDSLGVQVQEGGGRGVDDWLAVLCHNLLWGLQVHSRVGTQYAEVWVGLEKAKSPERNCLEYKDCQIFPWSTNSTPNYNNPLMSTHTIQRHRPSSSAKGYHQCSKSHEWGNYPAYGKVCGKCRGFNHFEAIYHSKGIAKGTGSPYKKKPQQQRDWQQSMGSKSGGSGKQ